MDDAGKKVGEKVVTALDVESNGRGTIGGGGSAGCGMVLPSCRKGGRRG